MTDTEQTGADLADKAARFNRLSAIAMALVFSAVVMLRHPDLALVFPAYVAISVYAMSFVRRHGILIRRLPVDRQNFAAYVAVSTAGFFATLFTSPQVIELLGSLIFIALALLVAFMVLRAILRF